MKVQIVQPLVPHYRVPLFAILAKKQGLDLSLTASWQVPGVEELEACRVQGANSDYDHKCQGLFGNRLLWQHGLKLVQGMESGDILVVCGCPRYLSNWPLIWKAKQRGIRCVWWGHAFGVRGNKFKNWIRLRMLRAFDAILLYTDEEMEAYRQLGIPSEKLFATNNGVDLESIDAARVAWDEPRLRAFQEAQGLVGKSLLLFCGRRVNSLDFSTVFQALQVASASIPNLELAIIGPSAEADQLRILSKEIGVSNRIRWVGELFEQEELAPWFLSAKTFVFPGSIGLSLLHAFAFGLPVILPRMAHRPEIAAFEDAVTGLYYAQGDEFGLSVCIQSLLSEESERLAMGCACVDRVSKKYNLMKMSKRMVEMFTYFSER